MLRFLLCGLLSTAVGSTWVHADDPLVLPQDAHLCLVGNALGERMQHQNRFETLLYQRFPEKHLVVRNLCFPGDEVTQQIRSFNFGSPHDHLKHSRADIVLLFFGYNESFRDEPGEESFRTGLLTMCREMSHQNYSGNGMPQIVCVSPIAFENTGDPNLPDGTEHNRRLANYTELIKTAADQSKVRFVDLFHPTKALFEEDPHRLTLNGFHLNAEGYRQLAPILMDSLFGPAKTKSNNDERLRAEIQDKNFHWWHRYRAVNGYSIYGKRNQAGFDGTYRNVDVMERERAILDQMCANRDRRIWAIAAGQAVPPQADDSNTLPFLQPKTNVKPTVIEGKNVGIPYLSAEEQRHHFQLADGYEVDLIACEEDIPQIANPVAINFDRDGRLWVSTMISYPQWKPKTELEDKLLILTDADKEGRFHGCTVFADGLHQPTGFELGHGGVYVAQQPDILFLPDADGDDRADGRIRQLVGFDTADSHHGIAAFEWGPGGGLYFQEGTFKQSQVESPHGVERLSDAGVWRYDPRSEDIRVFASVPFANPWGHVFDQWGQDFIADASDGLNYWAAPMSGKISYPNKHPGGWIANKGWDKLPLVIPRHIRPTSGCELVSTRQFPSSAQGNYLLNNVIGFQGVLQYSLDDSGAGYAGTQVESLISCTDGNFRPVDLQFGPDGALYIVDWHNALIGHLQHNLRDPNRDRSHGRIWRVRATGRPLLEIIPLSTKRIPELLDLLLLPEERQRYRIRRELAARPTAEVMQELTPWLQAKREMEPTLRDRALLEALWISQAHHRVRRPLLLELLQGERHEIRAAAVRVLSYWLSEVTDAPELLRSRLVDPHPRVRLEAVRACSFLPKSDQAVELALEVVEQENDRWIDYTLEETLRELER